MGSLRRLLYRRRDNRRFPPSSGQEHDASLIGQIRETLTRTKTRVDDYIRTVPRRGDNRNSSADLSVTRTRLEDLSSSIDDFLTCRNTGERASVLDVSSD
jgi:DNA-binding winged helix-turn-helix (wHTH) protein